MLLLDFYSASHLVISANPITMIMFSSLLILPFHFHFSIFQYSSFTLCAVPSLSLRCAVCHTSFVPNVLFSQQKRKNESRACFLKKISFCRSNAFFKTLLKTHRPFPNRSNPKFLIECSNPCTVLLPWAWPLSTGQGIHLIGSRRTKVHLVTAFFVWRIDHLIKGNSRSYLFEFP